MMLDRNLFILRNIAMAFCIWFFQNIIQLVGVILGIFVIPIALHHRRVEIGTQRQITTPSGKKVFYGRVRLPEWALLWDNVVDGAWGDPKLRWWFRDSPTKDARDWLSMFWWMAIRNPFNYGKRFILSVDIRNHPVVSSKVSNEIEYKIESIAGVLNYDVRDDMNSRGWQFLKIGMYYHFYLVYTWSDIFALLHWYPLVRFCDKYLKSRALVIQLGNKFKLSHRKLNYGDKEYKYYKGFTFEINPFKYIG